MTHRQVAIVALCLFIISNEIGLAVLYRGHSLSKAEDDVQDKTQDRFKVPSGALAYLLKLGYQGLELTSQYFADITTLVSVISTFYAEAVNCKSGKYNEVYEWSKEADETVEFLNKNSHKINEIQLEIKQTQIIAESLNYHYNETLKLLQEVGGLSESLLYAIEPNLPKQVEQSTVEIEKAVLEKENGHEEIDYVVVAGDYVDRIDKGLQVAVPVMSTIFPRIPKIIVFAKNRLGNLNTINLLSKFKNVKMPQINSKAFKAMHSWFSKTSSFVTGKMGHLRNQLTGKYSKALKITKGLAKGFLILTGYVGGAFNIYNTVKNFRKCEEVKAQTWQGLVEVRKAKNLYDEIWKNVTQAKTSMDKAAKEMAKRVSDDVFLQDLQDTKETLFAIKGPDGGIQHMIDSISQYIDQIKSTDDILQVHRLMGDLYQNALGSLPFVYKCLIDKTGFVRKVISHCKRGYDNLKESINTARNFHNFKTKQCENKLSLPDPSDDDIIQAVTKASKDEHFNINCKLNSKDFVSRVCQYHCNGLSASYIGSKLDINDSQAIKEQITKCPVCQVTQIIKNMICMERAMGSSDEAIHKQMPMLTLEQIQQVDCPK